MKFYSNSSCINYYIKKIRQFFLSDQQLIVYIITYNNNDHITDVLIAFVSQKLMYLI